MLRSPKNKFSIVFDKTLDDRWLKLYDTYEEANSRRLLISKDEGKVVKVYLEVING